MKRVAVVGGGWAGLAAAVRCTQRGAAVTVFEMAPHWGGRARSVVVDGQVLDNGQHILIGAYVRTLSLMRDVGVDTAQALLRRPLELLGPDGQGLRLPNGHPVLAFARGVLGHPSWTLGQRLALLQAASGWALRGFDCAASLTVSALCRKLPHDVLRDLVEPLCVAALNTPAAEASARVFLRVLRDALFSGPGSADLLLPRKPLGDMLPEAASQWLTQQGAKLRLTARVNDLAPTAQGWTVDGEAFDAVVLACSGSEAARLAQPHAPGWAAQAAALRYEPIITVVVDAPGTTLPAPMLSLPGGPAQFLFDLGALGGVPGRLTAVISGAQNWVDVGRDATAQAVIAQLQDQLPPGSWQQAPRVLATLAEKRATFRCTPSLQRPSMALVPGLWAAGDYIAGPYPATLEGAVRAGEACAAAL